MSEDSLCIFIPTFAYQPPRRLWCKRQANQEDDGEDPLKSTGRTNLVGYGLCTTDHLQGESVGVHVRSIPGASNDTVGHAIDNDISESDGMQGSGKTLQLTNYASISGRGQQSTRKVDLRSIQRFTAAVVIPRKASGDTSAQ